MESIFESIQPFGRFQKINTAILGSISLISALHFYAQIFNMAEPKLHCHSLLNSTNGLVDNCLMWKNFSHSPKSPYSCEFKDPYYNRTAINDWKLVCDKQTLIYQSQTIFFIGSLCILLNGFLTDRFGRRKICVFFMITISVLNLIYQLVVVDASTIFSFLNLTVDTKFILYCVYQFIAGFFVYSLYASAYVMAIEFTNHEYHTLVANTLLLTFITGEVILLIMFYLTRNWVYTNWLITGFTLASTVSFISFVPESPRWLAEMGRVKDAMKCITKIAKLNQIKDFKLAYSTDAMSTLIAVKRTKTEASLQDDHSQHMSTINLFWPFRNLAKLIILFIVWNSINLNYSGVALGIISALNINPFAMFLLSAIFEALGILTCLTNDCFGRKRALFIQLFLVGVCSILISFLPDESRFIESSILIYTKVGLALIGRGLISGSYNTIYIFASELYEVKVRSTAILFLSSGGCLSTLIAPQINMLRVVVWKPLPYIIYGASCLFSASIILLLPETYKH